MVYVLIAFLVGATASALVMAPASAAGACDLPIEIDELEAQTAVLERRDERHRPLEQPPFRRGADAARSSGRAPTAARSRWRWRRWTGWRRPATTAERILRELGSSIGGSVRALDVACRVGSAEFGVIMAETDSRSASVAAERVLRAIARVRSPQRPAAAGRGRHRLLPGARR